MYILYIHAAVSRIIFTYYLQLLQGWRASDHPHTPAHGSSSLLEVLERQGVHLESERGGEGGRVGGVEAHAGEPEEPEHEPKAQRERGHMVA